MKPTKILIILITASLLSISTLAFGQSSNSNSSTLPSNTDAFGKGTNVLSVGVGLGGSYSYIGSGYTSSPNFVLSYDNGTFGNVGPGTISLGGLLSFKTASYDGGYTGPGGYVLDQSWTYFIIGIRSAYNWNFTSSSKFDPYIGLMLAYYDVTYSETNTIPGGYVSNGSYGSTTGLSIYIGARYYLSNKVGIWLELGTGYTNAALGVSFKF
jgi:hypothetical protein